MKLPDNEPIQLIPHDTQCRAEDATLDPKNCERCAQIEATLKDYYSHD